MARPLAAAPQLPDLVLKYELLAASAAVIMNGVVPGVLLCVCLRYVLGFCLSTHGFVALVLLSPAWVVLDHPLLSSLHPLRWAIPLHLFSH